MLRFRYLALAGLLAGGLFLPGPAAGSPATVELTGFAPPQVAQIEWALDLFAEARLDLPPLRLVHEVTTEPCRGRAGLHRRVGHVSVVHICTAETGPTTGFLLLHELAHAWDRHTLSDERRRAFLALRGLTVWQSGDAEGWLDYGAEQAAEMLVWALMDRPIWPVRLRYRSCAELVEGVRTLTGRAPLHGYRDYCDDPANATVSPG